MPGPLDDSSRATVRTNVTAFTSEQTMEFSSDEDVLGNIDRLIEARKAVETAPLGLDDLRLSAPPQLLAGLRVHLHKNLGTTVAGSLSALGAEILSGEWVGSDLAVFQTGRDLSFYNALNRSRTVLCSEADLRAFLQRLTPCATESQSVDPFALFARRQRSTKNAQWQFLVRPQRLGDFIGNSVALDRLREWLCGWRTNPQKVALLSGPCGVGKTTAALLLARTEGFEVLHLTAASARSKAAMEVSLRAVADNNVLSVTGELRTRRTCLLVMDELEGMGSEAGGLAHLMDFVRRSRQPIICIADDPSTPRLRTLAALCLQVRFEAPPPAEIVRSLLPFLQERQSGAQGLEELCEQFGGDIRRVLIFLQLWGEEGLRESRSMEKDSRSTLSPFAAARELLSGSIPAKEYITRARSLHFTDDGLMPLFLFENLPGCVAGELLRLDQALTELRKGAVTSRQLRASKDYGLGAIDALFNAALPAKVACAPPRQLAFPAALGKLSARGRATRRWKELCCCFGYFGTQQIETVAGIVLATVAKLLSQRRFEELAALYAFNGLSPLLVREGLHELLESRRRASPLSAVDSKSKAAFTQYFNVHSGWRRLGGSAALEPEEASEP